MLKVKILVSRNTLQLILQGLWFNFYEPGIPEHYLLRPCVAWSCLSLVPSFLTGERADFVLTADQPVANYWLNVNTAEDCDTSLIEGAAILRYEGAPESSEPFAPKPSDVEQASHSLTVSFCNTNKNSPFYIAFVNKLPFYEITAHRSASHDLLFKH